MFLFEIVVINLLSILLGSWIPTSQGLFLFWPFIIISLNSATNADAYATALNVMGHIEGLKYADDNGIAVMFIVPNNNKLKLIKSKKWYDLKVWLK